MARKPTKPRAPKRSRKTSKPSLSYLTRTGQERRNEQGRFISKDDWTLRSREIKRRLASKAEREQELYRLRQERAKEVARLQKARVKRTRTKTGKTKAAFKADTDAQRLKRELELQRDTALIDIGELPAPHESTKVGSYVLAVWRWYGDGAIDLAGEFLRAAREEYGDAVKGRVAVGTNYGKNGQWVGTRTLPLHDPRQRDDLWWALQRLTATVSGKEVIGTPDDGMNEVWAEVELILPGR